jgi:tetratricopeptide (TPR) repeat protein
MRGNRAISLLFVFTIFVAGRLPGKPQKTRSPLSEQDVVKLLKMGASNEAITQVVEEYGVGFQADSKTLGRLKESGAQQSLLEVIRRKAPSPAPLPSGRVASQPEPPGFAEASRHLRLGQLKAKEKDLEGALREFAEAEKIRPQWGDVFIQRGLVLADLERYSEAAAEWKKYLAGAAPGTQVESYSRQIAEWEKQAQRSQEANRLIEQGREELRNLNAEGAVKSLEVAAQLIRCVSNLLDLARAYLLKGDYGSLSKTAAQALAIDRHSALGFLYRAAAELGQGDAGRSMADVRQALSLNPELAYGYALLGATLERNSDSRSGQAAAVWLNRVDSNSASAHSRMGWVLWNGGSYARALDELRKATQLEPNNSVWSSDLAYALYFRGDVSGALAAARQALRQNPNSPSAHDAMGMALEGRGSLDSATQEYKEALRLSPPGHPAFLYHLNRVAQVKEVTRTGASTP